MKKVIIIGLLLLIVISSGCTGESQQIYVCPSGETVSNIDLCPVDNCVKEGDGIPVIPNAPKCCEGLTFIGPKEENIVGISGICTAKCGNGICDEQTESSYNCAQDCQTTSTSSCGDFNQSATKKNKCLTELAVKSNNVTLCFELDEDGQAYEERQPPMFVAREVKPYTRECIYEIIQKSNDYSLCNFIPGNGHILKCFEDRARETNDISICDLADDENVKNYCYAVINEDEKYCFEITNDYQRQLCILPFAIKTKNASLCKYASGSREYGGYRTDCCYCVKSAGGLINVEGCDDLSSDFDVGGVSGGIYQEMFNNLCKSSTTTNLTSELSEEEARLLAQKKCEKDGFVVSTEAGRYREDQKTWWFEMEGKIPENCFFLACLVNSSTGEADLLPMCGGVIPP